MRLGGCLAVVVAASCVDAAPTIVCDDGVICPADRTCAPSGGGCEDPARVEACAGVDEGAACELPDAELQAVCRAGLCARVICGDGRVEATEACDDANSDDTDTCTSACARPRCGDGVVQADEGCDDGDGANDDTRACTSTCQPNVCGDGLILAGTEPCDDGNDDDGDACRTACALPTCGDGVIQPASEACDDAAGNGDDRACTAGCRANVCGDGLPQLGVEACDDGAANAVGAACDDQCVINVCGDGVPLLGVEACDDGNLDSGDGCRADCGKIEACGDATVDLGEACDDADLNPNDGCDRCATTAWSASVGVGAVRVLADEVSLISPFALAYDLAGNLFVSEPSAYRIRRIDGATREISTVAGTGLPGPVVEGALATGSPLPGVRGLAVDGRGTLFFSDSGNKIWRIDAASGLLARVAGTGTRGFSGDGGPATAADLNDPTALILDGLGSIYFAESNGPRVRRIDHATGVIATVAGAGGLGTSGDGGPATAALFRSVSGLAVDGDRLLVADSAAGVVRVIDLATGLIDRFAGGGALTTEGADRLAANLGAPGALAVDASGVVIACSNLHRVRRVDRATGQVHTIAGNGNNVASGDGGPAIGAAVTAPTGLAVRGARLAILTDQRIRVVEDTLISTLAGQGAFPTPIGGAATATDLRSPEAVMVGVGEDPTLVVVSDPGRTGLFELDGGGEPRRVGSTKGAAGFTHTRDFGYVTALPVAHVLVGGANAVIAGGLNEAGFADATSWSAARFNAPRAVVADPDGNLYVADTGNRAVRRLARNGGAVTTIAGSGLRGIPLQGQLAKNARMGAPVDLALNASGTRLYVLDRDAARVFALDLTSPAPTIELLTDGGSGRSPSSVPSIDLQLSGPSGIAVDPFGVVFVADTGNHEVRQIGPEPVAVVVAGNSSRNFTGDGGDPRLAGVATPRDVAVGPDGSVWIADMTGETSTPAVLRRITPDRTRIDSVLGLLDPVGTGPAARAQLASPRAITALGERILTAGGSSGVVQAFDGLWLSTVVGRYPHGVATGASARHRDASFGDVEGLVAQASTQALFVAETSQHRLWRVDASGPPDAWTIELVAGATTPGTLDGAASEARFRRPKGLAIDEIEGRLLVADAGNHAVRSIDLATAQVSTLAGVLGHFGVSGEGGPATSALLYEPSAVAVCPSGVFIADTGNHRVRRLAEDKTLTTVLGDGAAASSGEGSPSSAFPVEAPAGLACDAWGNLFVTSTRTVRLLPADSTGVVDGTGPVLTIFGAAPRDTFPENVTSCLTGLLVKDDATVQVTDSCTGAIIELSRGPA